MNNQIEIGIIGAMKIEVDALKNAMTDTDTVTLAGIDFITGRLQGRSVVVAQCGIGKVFAAVCAQTMILTFAPSVIINTGVAGTLTDRLSIGQVALADRLVQHDMDTTALGDPAGLVSGINVVYFPTDPEVTACLAACVGQEGVTSVVGTVASGDQFISSAAVKARITETFDHCVACEMEGAAIAHVCYINDTPCAILRAISDGGDEEASDDYPTFCKKAADTAIRVLMRFLTVWQRK
ncbi:MAG: 5'-methylthioadenosine/adenosylhomocysteine nucleosidase [Ruminococcaceae bacterium]|nr:5'-methylthioadenosine/adenosylhomocysteine nucleosidase [Oscillospiraceae bacterium]